jgi:hypothetical protein
LGLPPPGMSCVVAPMAGTSLAIRAFSPPAKRRSRQTSRTAAHRNHARVPRNTESSDPAGLVPVDTRPSLCFDLNRPPAPAASWNPLFDTAAVWVSALENLGHTNPAAICRNPAAEFHVGDSGTAPTQRAGQLGRPGTGSRVRRFCRPFLSQLHRSIRLECQCAGQARYADAKTKPAVSLGSTASMLQFSAKLLFQ